MNLFFDTETTGINRRDDRIVQLAWILTDEKGHEVDRCSLIVRPRGYIIPKRASEVHGITTQAAHKKGHELEYVLAKFSEVAERTSNLVAHNLPFDFAILETAYKEVGLNFPLYGKVQIDTMRLSAEWCRLPKLNGRAGFKFPRLEELYYRLFGEAIHSAHDAMADTEACMRSYWRLVDLGVITPPDTKVSDWEKDKVSTKDYETGYAAGFRSGYLQKQFEINYFDVFSFLAKSSALECVEFAAKNEETPYEILIQLLFHDERSIRLKAATRVRITTYSLVSIFFFDTLGVDFGDLLGDFDLDDEDICIYNDLRKRDHKDAVDCIVDNLFNESYGFRTMDEVLCEVVNTFGVHASTASLEALSANDTLTPRLVSNLLFIARHKVSAANSKAIDHALRNHRKFDIQNYTSLLGEIYEAWSDDKIESGWEAPLDFDMRCIVASDEDCPTELLSRMALDDFQVQEQVLLNPRTDFDIIKKILKDFYWRIRGRDLSSEEEFDFLEGRYAPLTKYPGSALRINNMLTNRGVFSPDIKKLAISEAKFRDVANFL